MKHTRQSNKHLNGIKNTATNNQHSNMYDKYYKTNISENSIHTFVVHKCDYTVCACSACCVCLVHINFRCEFFRVILSEIVLATVFIFFAWSSCDFERCWFALHLRCYLWNCRLVNRFFDMLVINSIRNLYLFFFHTGHFCYVQLGIL